MRISVIIPIKNRAHLISYTLDSILRQTSLPHEIILVNDQSEDDLGSVIGRYPMVNLVKSDGTGPGAARNKGLRLATGDAIQFFDSDDLMTMNKFEVQGNLLARNYHRGLVYSPYIPVMYNDKDQTWIQKDVILQYYPLPNRRFSDLVMEGWSSITQACLFSSELIKKVGFWREDLMPHEDKEYWYRISLHASQPIHENESAVFYRQHDNQITDKDTKTLDRTKDGIRAFQAILELSKQNIHSIKSEMILRGLIFHYEKYANLPHSSEASVLGFYLNKLVSKIGRMKTGTKWMEMCGPKDLPFDEYLRLLDNRQS